MIAAGTSAPIPIAANAMPREERVELGVEEHRG
jgi:hypothetical protein